MNVSLKQDTSYLFNSMNKSISASGGVAGLASLVSDYNTIKNGSYNKLVKAYYAKMGDDAKSTGKSSVASTDYPWSESQKPVTNKKEASKEYTKISDAATSMKSAVNVLSEDAKTDLFADSGSGVDRDKINSAVSDFVDSYNSLIKAAGSSSSSSVQSRAEMMMGTSVGYFNQLQRVGITVEESGKLTLDKDKLAAAGTDSIKSLFHGRNTYGDKVSSNAAFIESGAASAASNTQTYTANGSNNLSYSSLFNTLA
ncbi:MAG: hypothetical protein IK096_01355 [Lachnospiraceae bacterium]|nr:hypothetical protein [Lachnospiraceae bacterium]